MSHIFISYNQADADFAAVLSIQIEKAGIDTWMDKGRLRPGQDWSDEIDQAILNASALVLIMSPDAKASEYVTYEWSFALGAGGRVIPMLYRDTTLHPRLARLHYLLFTNSRVRPWDEFIAAVEDAVSTSNLYSIQVPRNVPAHIKRAVLELDSVKTEDREAAIRPLAQSDHPSAREVLMAALRHPIPHVRWAAVYYGIKKDPETARECLSGVPELFRLGGHDANLRERVVQAALQMEPSDALSEFIDKICSEPEQFAEFAQAFGNYATVFFSQEKWDEVIQIYSVAILLSPDNGDYYRDRSRAYLRLNREGEARKDFDKALEYGAKIPQWVALEYTRWGDVESAMKAVLGSVNPSESRLRQAEALSNLGLYYIRAEQWQKAFDHTNKVLEMSDEVRWNWAIRVIAAHHLGLSAEEERARQEWRKRKSEFDIKALRPEWH